MLTRATTWKNLANVMLSEMSQIQKDKTCIILLIGGPWNRQIHRDRVEQRPPGAGSRGKWGVSVEWLRYFYLDDESWGDCVQPHSRYGLPSVPHLCVPWTPSDGGLGGLSCYLTLWLWKAFAQMSESHPVGAGSSCPGPKCLFRSACGLWSGTVRNPCISVKTYGNMFLISF